MDRSLATSADKRSAAYESIFGRPPASHHQYPRPPPGPTASSSASMYSHAGPAYPSYPPDYNQSQGQGYYYPQQQQQAQHYNPQNYTSSTVALPNPQHYGGMNQTFAGPAAASAQQPQPQPSAFVFSPFF